MRRYSILELETLWKEDLRAVNKAVDGFWQIELDRESRPITAFQTRWGQFQWTVGTMGLMPSERRALDCCFGKCLERNISLSA
ncbi:hypothetical protein JKP88DRAFT_278781 [Tribonema minus]|uniref:Uncharacterized protein n=1 Tax=Tribonema minus TaxID=303371 RepID=A0A836CCR5_9STRA|nr:hypothetical protein JKP88DRAFT_278781 [Tribonema minus]